MPPRSKTRGASASKAGTKRVSKAEQGKIDAAAKAADVAAIAAAIKEVQATKADSVTESDESTSDREDQPTKRQSKSKRRKSPPAQAAAHAAKADSASESEGSTNGNPALDWDGDGNEFLMPEASEYEGETMISRAFVEGEETTADVARLDGHFTVHIQNIYSLLLELQKKKLHPSDVLDELFRNPEAVADLFERMVEHFCEGNSSLEHDDSISKLTEHLKRLIAVGEKITKTRVSKLETKLLEKLTATKKKVEELNLKTTEMNRVLTQSNIGAKPSTPNSAIGRGVKFNPPCFTAATASSSEKIATFFMDLSLIINSYELRSDEDKCTLFLSCVSKAEDPDTQSMSKSIRTAVAQHAVDVPPDRSPFHHISYDELVKAVKQAFTQTDMRQSNAQKFLCFEVSAGSSFDDALREFFDSVKNSLTTVSFIEPIENDIMTMIRTQMLSVFEKTISENDRSAPHAPVAAGGEG